ncbi:N-acetylmuramoyl-L-alanine amidase [Streptomyces gobiensis]|uniref:N-acetylmuramoyl-L-alanine amidase n=1 Tax=Streptomyces gobiensis TaxID=2875706 RepID=UPI001E2E2F88|nr:N-acetylmuramoyl-L-alanine amidase [Streptomyces gobiensis]UGY91124.1 N-acetylmuramoyl-L-alanine amidase [Streptomyces gobiensis]
MSLGRRLFVTLALLLPLALAGGLVWLSISTRRAGDEARTEAEAKAPGPEPTATSAATPTVGDPGKPLHGKVIVLDPGHNPGNRDHARKISRSVDIGTGRKACDAVGAATNSGYPEAEFTLEVARKTRDLLQERGATVRFTHDADRPYGPCVDERAKIGNRAEADAAVSIHADGSAQRNRGFHVIVPASVRRGAADTTGITAPSRRLGERLVDRFAAATGTEPANYLGESTRSSALVTRGDLGGLNLSRVPKVFIECGNMRDPQDAALLTDPDWQRKAARGITDGIAAYLTGKQ